MLSLLVYTPLASLLLQPAAVHELWADHGSGSAHDVTLYSAVPPSNFFALSDYSQIGYAAAGTFTDWSLPFGPVMAVRELNSSSLLRPPVGWTKIYTARADKPMTLWRAKPAAGYVALGDVATTDGQPPPAAARFTTVHESCVVQCPADVMLWGDKDGKCALLGARGGAAAGAVSTGGFLADVDTYPISVAGAAPQHPCLKASCIASAEDVPEQARTPHSALCTPHSALRTPLRRSAPTLRTLHPLPNQIHVALGYTPDTMAVQWASAVGAAAATLCARGGRGLVRYGVRGGSLSSSALAVCTPFAVASQLTMELWNATLTGLQSATYYDYRVEMGGDEAIASEAFSFATQPDAASLRDTLPHQFLVYGDLGHDTPHASSTIMPFATRVRRTEARTRD